jgi:hypothetical protein
MHERALETCEPSCVSWTAKLFFFPVVHSPPGAMGHVAAPELPSQEGRTQSRGTHGNTGAHLVKKARFRAKGHMAAPKLTSARRRGPRPRDAWQHRSSLQHGARSEAVGHVVALDPTSTGRYGHVAAPELISQEGRAQSQGTCGSVGAHLSTEARSWTARHMVAPEPPLQGGMV